MNKFEKITVMLLGMWEGHFASLFPSLIESNIEYFDLHAKLIKNLLNQYKTH